MRIIVSILSFLVIASSPLFSQLLNFYTARDGYDTAKLEAAKSIPNPKLVSILATTKASFEFMQQTIQSEIDTETGNSNMWVYVFRDTIDINMQAAIFVVDISGLGKKVYHADVNDIIGEESPVNFENLIPTEKWMDSPEMMANLMNEESFSSLINSGKEYELGVSLVYDADYGFLTPERTIWGGRIDIEEKSHACAVDVESNEVFCADLTSVEVVTAHDELRIYPNPASDMITIQTGSSSVCTVDVTVYDAFGRIVMAVDKVIVGEQLGLPVSELAAGSYFLVVDSGSATHRYKFNVVR